LLIVVAIVSIMAAVALPGIGQYIRNYKIRGAAQEVTGELQAARSKAIMSNTNAGVSFVVVDLDSYRFVQEDLAGDERFGPLKDLPQGVTFEVATAASSGPSLRFNRLGGYCNPEGSSCAPAVATVCRTRKSLPDAATGWANYVALASGAPSSRWSKAARSCGGPSRSRRAASCRRKAGRRRRKSEKTTHVAPGR
jgi:type II secretory pathway pseudopilin PulG